MTREFDIDSLYLELTPKERQDLVADCGASLVTRIQKGTTDTSTKPRNPAGMTAWLEDRKK